MNVCIPSKRCIFLVGELISLKKDMIWCYVYAANVESERRVFWYYLLDRQSSFSLP